jgi:hypothetical protein
VVDTLAEGANVGQITIVDLAAGTLAIVGNECAFTGSGAHEQTGFYGEHLGGGGFARALGRGLLGRINVNLANTDAFWPIGWMANNDILLASREYTFRLFSDASIRAYRAAVGPIVGTYAATTVYDLVIVIGGHDLNGVYWDNAQAAANYLFGASWYIQGGIYATYTLMWRDAQSNTSPLYAAFADFNASGTIEDFRIPDVDLSAVLQPTDKDTFTDPNGTNLTAHIPDVGGMWLIQGGGAGWDIQGNRARTFSVLDYATKDTGLSDALAEVVGQLPGGAPNAALYLVFRYTNTLNHWRAVANAMTNQIEIHELNAGVDTLRAFAAVVLGVGVDYTIREITDGADMWVFLDGGNRITWNSVFNQAATRIGLRTTTNLGSTFDNFGAWPRTSAVYNTEFGGVA